MRLPSIFTELQKRIRLSTQKESPSISVPQVGEPEVIQIHCLPTCNVVLRFDNDTYYYQLMCGLSMFFRSSGGIHSIGNQCDMSLVQSSLKYAGERENIFYFYSLDIVEYDHYDYTFYSCRYSDKLELFFGKIREETMRESIHFAIQQPYFLNPGGNCVESFTESRRIRLPVYIRRSESFFCRRDTIYIVTNKVGTRHMCPKASSSENVVFVTLPESTKLPHSVYVEDKTYIYMLCGDRLVLIDDQLDMKTIDLNCCDRSAQSTIAGITDEQELLINAHDSLFSFNLNVHWNNFNYNNTSQEERTIDTGYDSANSTLEEIPEEPDYEPAVSSTRYSQGEEESDSCIATASTSTTDGACDVSYNDIKHHIDEDQNGHSNEQIVRLEAPPPRTPEITHEQLQTQGQSQLEPIQDMFSSKFATEFRVVDILGVGGFGIVYEAMNVLDRWGYAVKRIAVEDNKDKIKKALTEVQAMAQFDHPGIVRYHSSWMEKPPMEWQVRADMEIFKRFPNSNMEIHHSPKRTALLYIQMQRCNYSLNDWIKYQKDSPRDIPRMISWFKQIVSAVAYIHDKGLIHRDLKPSNILFADADHLKICDLGIAIHHTVKDGKEVSNTYSNIGTQQYMAPEQGPWRYNSKVDVFTLGLILTEMCAIMDDSERIRVFANYRSGVENNVLADQPQTNEFVSWLTQTESEKRPTCKEMLQHPLLS